MITSTVYGGRVHIHSPSVSFFHPRKTGTDVHQIGKCLQPRAIQQMMVKRDCSPAQQTCILQVY
jgi:hypothetical protein